jgi:hypothetical protein
MSIYVLNDVFVHGRCWYSEKLTESLTNSYTVKILELFCMIYIDVYENTIKIWDFFRDFKYIYIWLLYSKKILIHGLSDSTSL